MIIMDAVDLTQEELSFIKTRHAKKAISIFLVIYLLIKHITHSPLKGFGVI